MDCHTDAWLEASLKRWQRDRSVERVLNTETSLIDTDGEGYQSQLWRISLDIVLGSGESTKKNFIVKKTSNSEFATFWNSKYGMFRREIHTYTGVLRKMENLMNRYGDPSGRMWPRIYGFIQHDTLILDDLKAKGYEAINRKEMMDLEDSLLVISNLARFHGMGMVLINQGLIERNEFGNSHMLWEDSMMPFFVDPLEDLSEAIENYWGPEWRDISRKIEVMKGEVPERFRRLLDLQNSLVNVINHGDLKTTNIMMKRNCLGKPMKCKMFDFQLTSCNTLAVDLHFFMFMSIRPDVRRQNYDELIESYHSVLSETLRFYEHPASQIPSLHEVKEEMKRTSLVGFLMIPVTGAWSLDPKDKLNMEVSPSSDAKRASSDKALDPAIFSSRKFKEWFAEDIANFFNHECFC